MGMFDQVKELMRMRSEQKRMQSALQKICVEHSNGGICVRVRGDMTVESVKVEESAYDEVKQGKSARFETMLVNTVNMALKKAKDAAQSEMMQALKDGGFGGLSSMLGK